MSILRPISTLCVGIDFGTTSSSVCLFLSSLGSETYNFVEFEGSDKFLSAKIFNKQEESRSPKRFISEGLAFDDEIVQKNCIDYLFYLRHSTNRHFKEDIRNAVITVPARFDDLQRKFISESATKAGWNVIRLLAEPTAAFLSQDKPDGVYGIYDLGGGTFDFSAVKKTAEVVQVLSTSGKIDTGGDYFDESLSEKLKITLEEAKLKRESGECEPDPHLLSETISIARSVIEEVGGVEEIIMVGGCSLSRATLNAVNTLTKATLADMPQLAVAMGAARHAYKMGESGYLLIDVLPLSISIEITNGLVEVLLPRNSPLPATKEIKFTNINALQTHIIFHLLQGESLLSSECRSLGEFEFPITPGPARSVEVTLRCLVDTAGRVKITCKDSLNKISFESDSCVGLTKEKIQELIKAGGMNIVEKELKRRLIMTCDRIDTLLNEVDDPEWKLKRQNVKALPEAEALLSEIEECLAPIIERKLIDKIQKMI